MTIQLVNMANFLPTEIQVSSPSVENDIDNYFYSKAMYYKEKVWLTKKQKPSYKHIQFFNNSKE
jgi:hypothetical protein